MRTLQKLGMWLGWLGVLAGGLYVLMFLLLVLEATGGHDGWLCEWGYTVHDGDDGCE